MPRKSSRQPSTQTIDQGQQQFDQDQTAGPSLLPFTIRKAVSLSHSPDLDETTWLSKEADDTDMDIDMGYMGFIGMNPNLQTPIQAADPLLLQPTNQRQELALESRLTAIQQTDLEKDSGYYSIYDTDLDKMFM
ncbi:Ff.00g059380.m01.CDS01 [Fusarium sp. VM40]|nr:Ff.00g059380.m01.CDS01 [Fusarium sp. VM40]